MKHIGAAIVFVACVAGIIASHALHAATSMDDWLGLGAFVAFMAAAI